MLRGGNVREISVREHHDKEQNSVDSGNTKKSYRESIFCSYVTPGAHSAAARSIGLQDGPACCKGDHKQDCGLFVVKNKMCCYQTADKIQTRPGLGIALKTQQKYRQPKQDVSFGINESHERNREARSEHSGGSYETAVANLKVFQYEKDKYNQDGQLHHDERVVAKGGSSYKPEKIEFLIRQREKSVAIPNGRPKVLSLHRKFGKEIVVVVAKILFV